MFTWKNVLHFRSLSKVSLTYQLFSFDLDFKKKNPTDRPDLPMSRYRKHTYSFFWPKELIFLSVLKMMQSQISFYPDRNFHAMKIWKKTRHAPTYPRHADTNFSEKKCFRSTWIGPPITWLEKNMGYFKTSKFPRFRKFPGNDFTPTYIFRGTLLIPISFFLHKWRNPGEFCHGC